MRRNFFLVFLSLSLLVLMAGCKNQTGDQPASDNSAGADKSGAAGAATSPKSLVVPEGTAIAVVLDQAVGSKTSQSGQRFDATVADAIEVDGKVAVPKGARATGIVREARAAGKFKGGAVLSLTLSSLTIHGTSYDIKTSSPSMASKGKGKRSAGMIGGGAAGGAIIGALAGGGKGAAIGAAVGAAAGTGGAAFTGNRDITLPAETALTFKLTQPLEIKEKP